MLENKFKNTIEYDNTNVKHGDTGPESQMIIIISLLTKVWQTPECWARNTFKEKHKTCQI